MTTNCFVRPIAIITKTSWLHFQTLIIGIMKLANNILIITFMLLFCLKLDAQTNNISYKANENLLIPLMKNNKIVGYTFVYKLDQVSKDTDSYAISIYDENLYNLGEKKINIKNDFSFDAASYCGDEYLLKFVSKKKGINYIMFDQQAKKTMDTTILYQPDIITNDFDFKHFQSNEIFPISDLGVVENLVVKTKNGLRYATIFISKAHKVVVNDFISNSRTENMQILFCNKEVVLRAIYEKAHTGHNLFHTKIEILSTLELIPKGKYQFPIDVTYYPISADYKNGQVEIISQYNYRLGKYSTLKYGLSNTTITNGGNFIKEEKNELTQSLISDSVAKRNKLIQHAYPYFHLAQKLPDGNWLLAFETVQRTKNNIRIRFNNKIVYAKSNIGLMELNSKCEVLRTYVENVKKTYRVVHTDYTRQPHMGVLSIQNHQGDDFRFFMQGESNLEYAFVYLNYNNTLTRKTLGNIVYTAGEFSSDHYALPKPTSTNYYVFPISFKNCLMIEIDKTKNSFDINKIKFTN
ncbi:MAG: DUF6770 family protein [Chitinophagaceae bacterium]